MSDCYDRAGNSITHDEWVALYTEKNKRVAHDRIGTVSVSTVWLGLNHNWGDGPPLIFETMIFEGPLDQEQWRYSTEEEALAGHEHAVELVKASK